MNTDFKPIFYIFVEIILFRSRAEMYATEQKTSSHGEENQEAQNQLQYNTVLYINETPSNKYYDSQMFAIQQFFCSSNKHD
jgi:hypothetical protein